jgi:triphosphoribosyl-dephospho-CoA synthetase
MLQATGGVNTHKGAIFTLGILCGAAGRNPQGDLLAECAAMTKGVSQNDLGAVTPENAQTAGQRLYAQYGITGVRGQAEAGFPTVRTAGLPTLEAGLSRGLDWNNAGCAALLAILAQADDTNLIHRSDRATQQQLCSRLQALLRDTPFPTREALEQLDEEFIQKNLSPGGSADLLAASFFLYLLKTL